MLFMEKILEVHQMVEELELHLDQALILFMEEIPMEQLLF